MLPVHQFCRQDASPNLMGIVSTYAGKGVRGSDQNHTSIVLVTSLFCQNANKGGGVKYLADLSIRSL